MTSSSAPRAAAERVSPRVLCAVAVLLLTPFPVIIRDFSNNGRPYDYVTAFFPVDLAFALLVIASARPVVADLRARRVGWGWRGWLGVTAALGVAFVAHPSARGIHVLLEMLGVVALAYTFSTTANRTERALLFGTVGAVGVTETAWAVAQHARGTSLGLTRLGEAAHPFYPFPGFSAPQGSMNHVYVLAGLALVTASVLAWQALISTKPAPWLAATAIAVAPVGFTFSRAAALGFVMLVGALVVAKRSGGRRWLVVGALVLGVAIPALRWSSGWRHRATETASAASGGAGTSLGNGRSRWDAQARQLIEHHPLVGVGPGQYLIATNALVNPTNDPSLIATQPVHDIPALITAEAGILGALAALALLVAIAWQSWRAGWPAMGALLAFLPFFLFDHFAYNYPQGVVILAVWLGVLDAMARTPRLQADTSTPPVLHLDGRLPI